MTSVHEYPDALVLTEFIDAVVFVVAAESTPLEKIMTAQNKIKDRDLLGIVLNKAFL
jgi:Mrp family chromosome partitioning ATPase